MACPSINGSTKGWEWQRTTPTCCSVKCLTPAAPLPALLLHCHRDETTPLFDACNTGRACCWVSKWQQHCAAAKPSSSVRAWHWQQRPLWHAKRMSAHPDHQHTALEQQQQRRFWPVGHLVREVSCPPPLLPPPAALWMFSKVKHSWRVTWGKRPLYTKNARPCP